MPLLKLPQGRRQVRGVEPDDRYAPLPGRFPTDLDLAEGSGDSAPGASGLRAARPRWLEACANPACRSGWRNLWRSRSAPVFEDGWNCSAGCTRLRLAAAVRRELEGRLVPPEAHRHRIPLGLTMLEQGWITPGQLRRALEAQRSAGGGRLGHWLVRQQGVDEKLVTRALGLQWSCPVLTLEFHDPDAVTPLLPRLFVDAFGALPLRVAAGKVFYLGFEDRLDAVLALAIERMTGLRVECGLVQGSHFGPAHTRMLGAKFPRIALIEAASEPAAVHVLSKAIERTRPADSRLVRVHDCLWLRMFLAAPTGPVPESSAVEDLICSIGSH
jgi:Type II secretion system (T2SS), protein E, N-terminal domain